MKLPAIILLSAGVATSWLPAKADNIPDFGPITNSSSAIQRNGMVVWMDLLTNDVSRAAKLYQQVFNWAFDFSDDGIYAYASLDGEPVASMGLPAGLCRWGRRPGLGWWAGSDLIAGHGNAQYRRRYGYGWVRLVTTGYLSGRGLAAKPRSRYFGLLAARHGDEQCSCQACCH